MIEAVWENRVVSDDAINRCISILRHTLTPDNTHEFIETVTRRGYVAHFPPPAEAAKEVKATFSPVSYWQALSILAVLAIVAWVYFSRDIDIQEQAVQAPTGPVVIAALPFTTSGNNDDGALFASGVHDDLLTHLAQLQSMRVISRTSVMEYRDSNKNIREIGAELGADAIIEGSVQSTDSQIRINVQLIDVDSDQHLWAQTYDRKLTPKNLFAVQEEIARAISSAMRTQLTSNDVQQFAVLPTQNMAAYRAYHQAMTLRDAETLYNPAYRVFLEQAVTLDPSFVRAWAELAGLLSLENINATDPQEISKLEDILENILSLAPDSAEYLIAQAYYTYYVVKNYEQAHELAARAQAMRPSDVRIVELKSNIERRLGNFVARAESLRLAQSLDPRNPLWTNMLLYTLTVSHRYDQAIEEIKSSPFANFRVHTFRNVLEVRRHRDFGLWLQQAKMLQDEFGDSANPRDLWDALIANRDFETARTLARSMPEEEITRYLGMPLDLITDRETRVILSSWFVQDQAALDEHIKYLGELAAQSAAGEDLVEIWDTHLIRAMLAALQGNSQETERHFLRWQRAARIDLAELTNTRHFGCRLLGMGKATSAAVSCIRESLAEPSYIMPFIEPFLPYYDGIRHEPEFIALLAEPGIGEGVKPLDE